MVTSNVILEHYMISAENVMNINVLKAVRRGEASDPLLAA